MRLALLSSWIRADEQGNTSRHHSAKPVSIEPLEHRQLLTVASPMQDLTAPLHASARPASKKQSNNDNSSALPNMLGIYKGRFTVKRAVGVSPGSKLVMVLRFNQETVGGQLAGTLNLNGVGIAGVTGTITGRDVNLAFANGDNSLNGTITGTVTQDGEAFGGKVFSQINGTAVRGTFSLDKKRTFPFAFSDTLTLTTGTTTNNVANNNLNPAFLASQANGFISSPTPTTTGINTGTNVSGGTPFVVQPTPIVTPITNPVSNPITGLTSNTVDLLSSSTVPSAGSTLQNPFSSGSVLNTSIGTPTTTAFTTPTITSDLFSTTPIGSTAVF
ncbi:MAG: hypothetical protein ACM359_09205 [Bacillota bacterium]